MAPYSYLITALAPSATLADAFRKHWREYLMEAAELCVLRNPVFVRNVNE
jgi:hypothetical protein